jgi:arylsulfatase A-like enzyme
MKSQLPIFFASVLGFAHVEAQQRNVLLIIADGLGTDSLALYNSTPGAALPPTPNINALKANGVQFRNAYAHPTCSPTRASILTGRQPFRHGVTTAVSANDGQLMASEFTLPRAFSANNSLNYGLAHFGKWHLSVSNNMANDPANIAGWPHFAGSLNGGLTGGNNGTGTYTAWTKTINGVTGTPNSTTTYATTDTTNDTISWINDRGTNPWFAWVAYNAPHSPFHKPPSDLHTYNTTVPGWNTLNITTNLRTHFNAAIQALDTEIGRLFNSISPTVLANTWIILIGDNGTPNQVIQTPFSDGHSKESLYEGGARVPLIVSGPGLIAPNREIPDLVHATDLYASILEMAGIDVAATNPFSNPSPPFSTQLQCPDSLRHPNNRTRRKRLPTQPARHPARNPMAKNHRSRIRPHLPHPSPCPQRHFRHHLGTRRRCAQRAAGNSGLRRNRKHPRQRQLGLCQRFLHAPLHHGSLVFQRRENPTLRQLPEPMGHACPYPPCASPRRHPHQHRSFHRIRSNGFAPYDVIDTP